MRTNEEFEIHPGKEPHIQVVKVFYCEDGWDTMQTKWEIHKLEGGYVLVGGLSGKPKYVFQKEDDVMEFLLRTCGTFRIAGGEA